MDTKVQPSRTGRRNPSMAFLQACFHGHSPEHSIPERCDELDAIEQAYAERIAESFCDVPQHRISVVMRGFADLAARDLSRNR